MTENCAFLGCGECEILIKTECAGCAFYKTNEELRASRQKALLRLGSLPPDKQMQIIKKYYGKNDAEIGFIKK